jgi:hypothetical protein
VTCLEPLLAAGWCQPLLAFIGPCWPVLSVVVVVRAVVVVDARRWVDGELCLHKHDKHGKHDQIIC